MIHNNLHNLMTQMTTESKSLWRIKNHYVKDAEESPEAQTFWKKMIEDKEAHIKELKELIKKELE
ncbi:MAG: hypothetical protein WC795_02560 [Candidatus Paceibacterota bacterium]